MAGSASNYLENALTDHFLGRATTELSTGGNSTLFVALLTVTYDDAWAPTDTGECAGSTYARVNVANTSDVWTNSTAGSKQNKTAITFTTSAGSDWGTIKSYMVCDTSTTSTGNALFGADLSANQTVSAGNTVSFATGTIVLTLS